MKIITTLTLSMALLFSLAISSTVYAEEYSAVKINTNANIENSTKNNDANENESDNLRNSTSTPKEKNESATTTKETENNDEFTSETHRDAMASFMKNILNVADREDGIGDSVRRIAREQDKSASTTTFAMDKVEHMGSTRKFFLGSDYKNLGVIRSEIASTTNNISQLKNLLDRTTNSADRVLLDAQIKSLEAEQVKLNAYITIHEDSFSMFGWFMKMFSK